MWSEQSLECRYGVGQIYFRQEKYEMAEYHFRRSLLINPRSSVLRCYVGLALHKINRFQDALEQLQVCTAQHSSCIATPVIPYWELLCHAQVGRMCWYCGPASSVGTCCKHTFAVVRSRCLDKKSRIGGTPLYLPVITSCGLELVKLSRVLCLWSAQ